MKEIFFGSRQEKTSFTTCQPPPEPAGRDRQGSENKDTKPSQSAVAAKQQTPLPSGSEHKDFCLKLGKKQKEAGER